MSEPAAPRTVRLEAHVSGHVQGVGYRVFAQRQAHNAGCTGCVRNGSDGRTVVVVAEGLEPALESLLEALRQGPRLAHVTAVILQWLPATGEFSRFAIGD